MRGPGILECLDRFVAADDQRKDVVREIDIVPDGEQRQRVRQVFGSLEREFGLVGGDIFHGALGLDQLFSARPVLGHGDYRGPLKGLYMCGSGTHPGGGVMGASGRNAAMAVLGVRA